MNKGKHFVMKYAPIATICWGVGIILGHMIGDGASKLQALALAIVIAVLAAIAEPLNLAGKISERNPK